MNSKKNNYKQLTDLHIKTQTDALETVLRHTESDAEVFSAVRDFLLSRARIEASYANDLEKLVKTTRIRMSKGGTVRPNNPLSRQAATSPSGALRRGISGVVPASGGLSPMVLGEEGVEALRPVDLVTSFLVEEAANQALLHQVMATRMSQRIAGMVQEWEKCFSYRIRQANEYSYVIKSEFKKLTDGLMDARSSCDRRQEALRRARESLQLYQSRGKDEASAKLAKAKTAQEEALESYHDSVNAYVLALRAANAYVAAFKEEAVPRFFDACNGLFVADIKKILSEFDRAATTCYRDGLNSIQALNDMLAHLSVNTEFAWFEKNKSTLPDAPLLYFFDPMDDALTASIVVTPRQTDSLTKRLERMLYEREKAALSVRKLETDIRGTEQLVDIYTQDPAKGHFLEPLIESVDYRFRLLILRSHSNQLAAQIAALEDAGIAGAARYSTLTLRKEYYRILAKYVSAHDSDVSVQEGDKVKIPSLKPYDGWVMVTTPLGTEGYIPVPLIDGMHPDTIVKVHAVHDYDATCTGELSFRKGDVIRVTDMDIGTNAWWEGEVNGVVGQFPRSLVEPPVPAPVSLSMNGSEGRRDSKASLELEKYAPAGASTSVAPRRDSKASLHIALAGGDVSPMAARHAFASAPAKGLDSPPLGKQPLRDFSLEVSPPDTAIPESQPTEPAVTEPSDATEAEREHSTEASSSSSASSNSPSS